MCCITLLLFFEYRAYTDQCSKMLALANEYQWYKQTYQKLLLEYMQLKHNIAQMGTKELFDKESCDIIQPEDNCFWVNREADYLRTSALDFAKLQNMPTIFNALYNEDEWLVGQGLAQYEATKQQVAHTPRQRTKKTAPAQKTFIKQPQHPKELPLHWPIDRTLFWISSIFGPRKKADNSWGFHYGIDMAALKGIPVKAAHAGTVVQAGTANGYGNMIVIKHSNKYCTRYAHLDTIGVSVGQTVKTGKVIGTVGNTGLVRGKNGAKNAHHLHFEVLAHGKQINPLTLLS